MALPASGASLFAGRVKMLQLNCNNRMEVGPTTARYMVEHKVQIAMLQEQFSGPTGMPAGFGQGMRAFCFAGSDIRNANQAAVIVNAADIDVVPMTQFINEYGTCVWTRGGYGELIVCSIYCKFRSPIGPYMEYLEAVVEAAGGRPLIVGMDANARSRLWHSKVRLGCRDTPVYGYRGQALEAVALRRNMVVVNEPSQWFTFCGPRGQSDIDVTLANTAFGNSFQSKWVVVPVATTSDHNAILIDLEADRAAVVPDTMPVRWNTRGADWRAFRLAVCDATADFDVSEMEAEQLQLALDEAVGVACQEYFRRESVIRAKLQLWWCPELSRMRRQLRRARLRYQLARKRSFVGPALTEEVVASRREYRAEERVFKKRMQELKLDDWRRFVEDSSNANPWGVVYRMCRQKASTTIGSLRVCGGVTMTWEEAAAVLLRRFLPQDEMRPAIVGAYVPEQFPEVITMEEVEAALVRFRAKRAPGLDGKRADIVRNVFAAVPDVMLALFNKCFSEGCFPKAWKEGNLVTFLKSPDKDPQDSGSYRPITLLPVIGKVLERIMVNRLAQVYQGSSPTQFGFRTGRSTVHAWLKAKELVSECAEKYVMGVFVDFRGAFDHLRWSIILEKLERVGCPEIAVWRSYFAGRKSCLSGRRSTLWRDAERGCPQGSICGPIMWNMIMDDLLDVYTAIGVRHVAYADDLLLIVPANSRLALEQKSVEAMQHAMEWGARVGVEVAFNKTEAMLLKGKFDHERQPNISVAGQRIAVKNSVKYLGIHVVEGMRFHKHIKEVHEKLMGVIAPLRRVLRRNWGLQRKATLAWINGLMKPVVMYGSPVWYEACQSVVGRKLILKTQNAVLMATLRTCRTVSTEAKQALSGSMPYDIEAVRMAVRFKCRNGLQMGRHDMLTDQEAIEGSSLALIDERTLGAWQQRWQRSEKGRTTFGFVPVVGPMPVQFDPPMRCSYLLTGHGSMNAYLVKHTLHREPACSCGWPQEDWRHILVDCRLYNDLRDLRRMQVAIVGGQPDVSKVLESRDSYMALKEFAHAAFGRRAALQPN